MPRPSAISRPSEAGSKEPQRRVQANVAQFSSFVSGLMLQSGTSGTQQRWRERLIVISTDAPLAAVGGAVFTMFVFAILDQVEQLGAIRDWFPTAEEFAWTDLLQTPVDSGDLFRGVIQSLVYSAMFTALAFRHFARRTSPAERSATARTSRRALHYSAGADRLGPALAHRGVGHRGVRDGGEQLGHARRRPRRWR